MLHVLFLSYDGMTDPLGQSQVIPYLKGLTAAGYRFTLVSCDKKENYIKGKTRVLQTLSGFPIEWVSIPYHKNPPVLSSVYDAWKMKCVVKAIHKKDPFHLVHTRPGVPTIIGLWMKKKWDVKFLNDIRGFWADERVDGGMWNRANPLFNLIYKFFKHHEAACIERADYNVCLTYKAKEIIHGWKHIKGQPVPLKVITCSVDLKLFNRDTIPKEVQQNFQKQLGIEENDLVFSYLGSIGGWYLTNEMMNLCKAIIDEIPTAKFLFISPHRHNDIFAAAKAAGVPDKNLFITAAARNEVPVWLSLSNYSFFFIKPCFSKLSSSPTKHGEIMAMGIPIITNSGVGDVDEIIKQYNGGIIINAFTEESYREAARKIKLIPPFDNNKIRCGAEEVYSLNKAVEQYRKVYSEIFNKN